MLSLLDIGLVVITLAVIQWLRVRGRKPPSGAAYPPGPPGIPLFGVNLSIPRESAWDVYRKWGKQYDSDVVNLKLPGTNIIVLNSLEAILDLFEKRSSIYSDRPYLTMLNELVGFSWTLLFAPYGSRFRDMRKAVHQVFNPDAVKNYREIELDAAHGFLRGLLRRPDDFMKAIPRFTGRVFLQILYGIEIRPEGDPYIHLVEEASHAFLAAANAGTYLVDFIPILKHLPEWFPGARFQTEAREWNTSISALRDKPFEDIKARVDQGQGPDCAAASLLGGRIAQKDPTYMEGIFKAALATMFGGAMDSTSSTLSSFILAMTLYPETQKKAQEEIDRVVGKGRLPTMDDFESLPYVTAVMKESLRWHPISPLGTPHRLVQDDVYKGYFIPKGSIIITNLGAILHDETMFPKPTTFIPERYFKKDGSWNPDILDPATIVFGYGRRVCPGQHAAKETIWTVIASVLASFTITKASDENGREIIPQENYTKGLIVYPLPFKTSIRPRSSEYEAMILGTETKE